WRPQLQATRRSRVARVAAACRGPGRSCQRAARASRFAGPAHQRADRVRPLVWRAPGSGLGDRCAASAGEPIVTGFTIVRNVSGPTTEIAHPDGTRTFAGEGNNCFGFGPISQGNTGEPGLVFASGLVVLQVGGGAVTSFSFKGKQVNGCDLLAG